MPLFQAYLDEEFYHELRKEALDRKINVRRDLIPEILKNYAIQGKEEKLSGLNIKET